MPALTLEAMLARLDEEQRAAVTAPVGPVRVLAGAGTGKTTTITHRIAYQHHRGLMPAQQVLAVTHSRRAASSLRDRLASLGVPYAQARTFHSAALRQLTHFWAATGLPGSGPRLLDDRRRLVRQALAAAMGCHPSLVESEQVLTTDSEIGWAHAAMLRPRDYGNVAASRNVDVSPDLVAAAYAGYEKGKQQLGVLDFDDVLLYCAQLLESVPAVRSAFNTVYRGFVVDEYQDTDPLQQRLLLSWLGGRDVVTVVGDPAQAIYGFKGADENFLLGMAQTWPGAVSVTLSRNYRSTAQVLEAANRVSSRIRGGVHLQHAPDATGPQARVRAYEDEKGEAAGIAAAVRDLIRNGTPPGEIAVLHRFNAQAPALRQALGDAGVPVSVAATDEFFSRAEVAAALRKLRTEAEADPDDDAVAVTLETLDAGGFDESTPPTGMGAVRARWEHQAALLDMVRTLAEEGTATLGPLVAELDRRAAAEHVPAGRHGVAVMTAHSAKGLEWDAVFVARATDGAFPAAQATSTAASAEELRLWYVALTRARRHLVVTWARTWGQRGARSTPSPFLHMVSADTGEQSPGRGGSRRKPDQSSSWQGSGSSRTRREPSSSHASVRAAVKDLSTPGWHPSQPGFDAGVRVVHDQHGMGRVVSAHTDKLMVDFGAGARAVRPGAPLQLL